MLEELDPSRVYVVGAIADRTVRKVGRCVQGRLPRNPVADRVMCPSFHTNARARRQRGRRANACGPCVCPCASTSRARALTCSTSTRCSWRSTSSPTTAIGRARSPAPSPSASPPVDERRRRKLHQADTLRSLNNANTPRQHSRAGVSLDSRIHYSDREGICSICNI